VNHPVYADNWFIFYCNRQRLYDERTRLSDVYDDDDDDDDDGT